MVLPAAFFSGIAAGLDALRVEENRLREAAEDGDPQLLLSLRDVEGLSGRIQDTSTEEWEEGSAVLMLSPEDLGVLDEIVTRYEDSPYRDNSELASAFGQLRKWLAWYVDHDSDPSPSSFDSA